MIPVEIGQFLWFENKETGLNDHAIVRYIGASDCYVEYNGRLVRLAYGFIGKKVFIHTGTSGVEPVQTQSPLEPCAPKKQKSRKVSSKPSAVEPEAPGKKDKTIVCVECGHRFVWTVEEQEYFASKHYSPPKTCSRTCRDIHREKIERSKEMSEFLDAMQPSEPYRRGSKAKNSVSRSGGDAKMEISDWTKENMEKGYTPMP